MADDYHRAPPDLAIEVLSPSQSMAHFTDKIHFYLLNGVRLVWVIDPIAAEVVVLTPDREAVTLTAGDTLDGGEVLPGFSVKVADIFAQTEI